jgi:hypothetical protein
MAKTTDPSGSKVDRIDTFVVAGVVTVLGVRTYLKITGYPQIGSDSLHVAHVLIGGAVLVSAFLILLLSERPNKLFAALLGGIGFGLFIDEIGKFVTKDNNYFYKPSFALIYITFLLIWFITRLVIVHRQNTTFLSPAEWPARSWMRGLIITWSTAQFLLVTFLLLSALAFGLDDVSDVLHFPELGIVLTIALAVSLSLGLRRWYQHEDNKAAHMLRGANLLAIVSLYPIIFFNYPVLASLGLVATLLTIIGLSEVSVVSLGKKLLIRH